MNNFFLFVFFFTTKSLDQQFRVVLSWEKLHTYPIQVNIVDLNNLEFFFLNKQLKKRNQLFFLCVYVSFNFFIPVSNKSTICGTALKLNELCWNCWIWKIIFVINLLFAKLIKSLFEFGDGMKFWFPSSINTKSVK